MAQRFYKIDQQDSIFPMLAEQQSRTIIGSTAGESPAKGDRPGVAYCHNVMPSRYGLDSVGYLSVIPAVVGLAEGVELSDARILYGNARTRMHICWDNEGGVYVLKEGSTVWLKLPVQATGYAEEPSPVEEPITGPVPPVPPPGGLDIPIILPAGVGFDPNTVTLGVVNGVSYILYSRFNCFVYNEEIDQLAVITLAGLTDFLILSGDKMPNVLGLIGSSGYLIAYAISSIAWSSTIDPRDFVPSQITGAGGGDIAGTEGKILFGTSNSLGLLLFTDANIIAGTYTGNVQFPFKFRPIDDSKGGINLDLIAYEANSKNQFVYSKAGLQSLTSIRAENILPEVTDFLAGKRFEDYDETTKQYVRTDLTTTLLKKIKYIASRYLVISYGISSFTHALVFDTSLNKLGKLRITHTDVFEYVGTQIEIARESISFLLPTGEVQVLDLSSAAASSGVLVLGKLQFVRSRLISLQGIEVENVQEGASLVVSSQVSLDGKNFVDVVGTLKTSDENVREYTFRAEGKNHSIVFIGKFSSITAQVRYVTTGKR